MLENNIRYKMKFDDNDFDNKIVKFIVYEYIITERTMNISNDGASIITKYKINTHLTNMFNLF